MKWKKIKGYPMYSVSNLGHIRNDKSKRILKQSGARYCQVNLSNNGIYRILVHRIVALAFIKRKNKKLEVNHLDGNKRNNRVTNLQWLTKTENQLHAYRTGLKKPSGPPRKVKVK